MDPLTAQQTNEYLAFLGVPKKEPFSADLCSLQSLIEAHLQRITFENIDVLLGRPIALDVNSLFAKVVERGRGGYCFELNSLQHVVLIVDLPEGEHLVDVGFGAANPYLPLPLNETQVSVNHPYWLRQIGAEADCEPGTLELCIRGRDEWITLYRIEPRDQRWRDCVPLNWYTCTNPDATMRRVLMMARTDGEAWLSLFNGRYRRRLRVCGGNAVQKREIKDVDELLCLIQTEFCLRLCPNDLEPLRSRLATIFLEEPRF
ncbi:hypothetical protein MRX96_028976 [Rhipicephalus microplus]